MTPVIILGGILGEYSHQQKPRCCCCLRNVYRLFVLKSLKWKDVPKVMTKAAMVLQ
ncbi:MAG: hypothetical protein CM1200mP13_16500 [Candidatus Pelagibacterales bacterium]|nr:MAG: hypothetical protein CM1200mP13_16500 [Pelagibacterales bacterium]